MNGIQELADILQAQSGERGCAAAEKLRLHVADTVGAWIAATQTRRRQALIAFRERMRATRQAAASICTTILPFIARWCG